MKRTPAITAERMESDLTEENTNVVPLKLITGGKGPPSDFWLKNLDIGTVFLARPKNSPQDFTMGEFCIYNITEKAILLLVYSQPSQPPQPLWVDPARFSNKMDMVEIIRTQAFDDGAETQQKEEEPANG